MEGLAAELLERAGEDGRRRVPAVRLARALLGPGRVFRVHAMALPDDAALVRVHDEERIYYRTKLTPRRRDFAVFHEIVEWHLARMGYEGEDIEDVSDMGAACLLAPRQLFLRLVRDRGERFPALARELDATESLCALRLGETTGEPVALVAPRLRVRGGDFTWPAEDELRRLASRRWPGVRKARLRDDPRRVVLRPAT